LIAAESTLTRRHYRAHADRDEDTGLAYLYAERCRWAQAGTIVSHLAALGLALAVVARPALSWQETDLILLPGQTLDVGHGRDMAVGLSDLKLETDPDGQTRSIRALLLLQVGDSPPITRTVGFNDPATHRGVSFHLQGYGRGARLTTPEGDRHLAFTGSQTHEVALTETGPALRIAHQPDEDALFVEAQAADGTMLGSGLVADGQEIKVQGIPVTFALSHYTLWQVSHDPTFAPALAAAAVLLAGMVFSLWLPYRRLWLRLDGKCAQMVGAGAFDGEFEDMAGEMMAAARSTGGPAGDIPLPEGDADG
jgi:cytochrome c biogenesis protein ResB